MKKKTSVVIDESLWKKFVGYTVRKYGTTKKISQEIEKALEEYLEKYA